MSCQTPFPSVASVPLVTWNGLEVVGAVTLKVNVASGQVLWLRRSSRTNPKLLGKAYQETFEFAGEYIQEFAQQYSLGH